MEDPKTSISKDSKQIILNNIAYQADAILPCRLQKRMTHCADNMTKKVRSYITLMQDDKKLKDAMGLITDLNDFMKKKKNWDNESTAANFQILENSIWWINGRISTWYSTAFECNLECDYDDEFYFE